LSLVLDFSHSAIVFDFLPSPPLEHRPPSNVATTQNVTPSNFTTAQTSLPSNFTTAQMPAPLECRRCSNVTQAFPLPHTTSQLSDLFSTCSSPALPTVSMPVWMWCSIGWDNVDLLDDSCEHCAPSPTNNNQYGLSAMGYSPGAVSSRVSYACKDEMALNEKPRACHHKATMVCPPRPPPPQTLPPLKHCPLRLRCCSNFALLKRRLGPLSTLHVEYLCITLDYNK